MNTTTTSPRSLPTTWLTCRPPQIPVGSQTHSDECLCCRSTTADWTYCGEDAMDLRWTRRSCNQFRCTVANTNTTPPVQLPLLLCSYNPAPFSYICTLPLPCLLTLPCPSHHSHAPPTPATPPMPLSSHLSYHTTPMPLPPFHAPPPLLSSST